MSMSKKSYLLSSRTGSAASDKRTPDKSEEPVHDGHRIIASKFWRTRFSEHGEDQSSTDQPPSHDNSEGRIAPHTLRSVIASLNKMAVLRQRAIANRGNVTRLTPFRKFVPAEVETEVERILSTALKGTDYDPKRSSVLVRSLSDTVRDKLKTMKFPRYKFVCVVTIVDKSQSGILIGSRCLMDEGLDNYATVTVGNSTIAATATVYAIHHE